MSVAASRTPPELRVVEEFCNSAVLLHRVDDLATPDSARAWLTTHGWDPSVDDDDDAVAALREVREAVRALIVNRADAAAQREFNRIAKRVVQGAEVRADGALGVVIAGEVPAPAGAAVSAILLHGLSGEGLRLKACASPDCRFVFYDHSRPRTRVWCDMNVCGARHKMRELRSRNGVAE